MARSADDSAGRAAGRSVLALRVDWLTAALLIAFSCPANLAPRGFDAILEAGIPGLGRAAFGPAKLRDGRRAVVADGQEVAQLEMILRGEVLRAAPSRFEDHLPGAVGGSGLDVVPFHRSELLPDLEDNAEVIVVADQARDLPTIVQVERDANHAAVVTASGRTRDAQREQNHEREPI